MAFVESRLENDNHPVLLQDNAKGGEGTVGMEGCSEY